MLLNQNIMLFKFIKIFGMKKFISLFIDEIRDHFYFLLFGNLFLMYFAKETDYKEKTKSVRKFSRDRLIPRIRSSKSFKGKDFLTVDNGEEDLIKSITERDMDEIIKEYETNPYFRTKMNLILKELGMKKEN